MSEGIFYIVYGESHYFREVERSVESLRKHCDLPIAIFTDKNFQIDGCMSFLIETDIEHNADTEYTAKFRLKLELLKELPFTGYISGPYFETINEYQKQHLIKRYIEGKIISGKREGIWLTFSEKGNLLFKTFYKNGSHNGIWESYHDNGNIKLKGNYKDSKLFGVWQSYSENGVLIENKTTWPSAS